MNGHLLTLPGAAGPPALPAGAWQAPFLLRQLLESCSLCCGPGGGQKGLGEPGGQAGSTLVLDRGRRRQLWPGYESVFLWFGAKSRIVKGTWGAGVLMAKSNLKIKEELSHIDQIYNKDMFQPPSTAPSFPPNLSCEEQESLSHPLHCGSTAVPETPLVSA